jgi:intraflagellar transport protein 52
MSLPVSLFDSGHREYCTREKRLNVAINTLMSLSEPKSNKDPFTADVLKNVACLWIFQPRSDLTNDEVTVLKTYLEAGGNIIFSCADKCPPNFAAFIKSYGMTISEPVISPVYINYIDPRHVTVQQGVLNRAITEFIKVEQPTFAYPNGYVLETSVPASPILSSGASSYPLNRPTIAVSRVKSGTLTVIGCPLMFSDEWFRKENNEQLFQFLVNLIITKKAHLNKIDREHPEVTERICTPDVMVMSERLRSCIQEGEKLRPNFTDNFNKGLFKMDMSFVADSVSVANTLGVHDEQLDIVRPVFDTALPPLTPAVFPPQMRVPKDPVLELFDLNDIFASKTARLAMLAQKTPPKNIEKFIIQVSKILNISQKLPAGKDSAKDVLEYVFKYIVKCKCSAQD